MMMMMTMMTKMTMKVIKLEYLKLHDFLRNSLQFI